MWEQPPFDFAQGRLPAVRPGKAGLGLESNRWIGAEQFYFGSR
jgi:hypothetical protein